MMFMAAGRPENLWGQAVIEGQLKRNSVLDTQRLISCLPKFCHLQAKQWQKNRNWVGPFCKFVSLKGTILWFLRLNCEFKSQMVSKFYLDLLNTLKWDLIQTDVQLVPALLTWFPLIQFLAYVCVSGGILC